MMIETCSYQNKKNEIPLFPSMDMEGVSCFRCSGKETKLNKIQYVEKISSRLVPTIFYPLCTNCISKLGGFNET